MLRDETEQVAGSCFKGCCMPVKESGAEHVSSWWTHDYTVLGRGGDMIILIFLKKHTHF